MTYTRQFDFKALDRGFSAELDVELDAIVAGFDLLPQRKYKTADQDKTGAGVVDDVHLAGFDLEAGGIYAVFGTLHMNEVSGGPNGKPRFTYVVSQTLAGDSFIKMLSSGAPAPGQIQVGRTDYGASGDTQVALMDMIAMSSAPDPWFFLDGYIVANASLASTFKLQFGNVIGTLRMIKGSWMSLEKLN